MFDVSEKVVLQPLHIYFWMLFFVFPFLYSLHPHFSQNNSSSLNLEITFEFEFLVEHKSDKFSSI